MSARVVLSPRALAQAEAAARWWVANREKAPDRFAAEPASAFSTLASAPDLAMLAAAVEPHAERTREDSFLSWTLDQVVRPFEPRREATWCHELVDGCLAFIRVELGAMRRTER